MTTTFEKLGLSKELLQSLSQMGFSAPTLIQAKTIPLLLGGKDVIGESSTGSGKTAAFGCSLVEHSNPRDGLQAIILTPTRELAEQVKGVIVDLAKSKKLRVAAVYGGMSINPQIHALKSANIVVATPGRFMDHMERGTIDTSTVQAVVLDEADRMLDMGFIKDMEFILKACKSRSQTMFFSATISKDIEKLSKKYMRDPVKVLAEKQVDPGKLRQSYYDVSNKLKLPLLAGLIQHDLSERIMVFCNMRSTVDKVTKILKNESVEVVAIHGGFTQAFRSKALDRFVRGRAQVLVCTDVAARGIHVDNVEHIYNYDLPKDPNDYVHRIGRTARAGEEGMVSNLVGEADRSNFSRVKKLNKNFAIQKKELPKIERIDMKSGDGGKRNAEHKERRSGSRGGFTRFRKDRDSFRKDDDKEDKPYHKRDSYKKDDNKEGGRSSYKKRTSYRKDDEREGSKRPSYRRDDNKEGGKRPPYKRDNDKEDRPYHKRGSFKKDDNREGGKRPPFKKRDSDNEKVGGKRPLYKKRDSDNEKEGGQKRAYKRSGPPKGKRSFSSRPKKRFGGARKY